jgi:ABC-type sugar transport system ATPase subunit
VDETHFAEIDAAMLYIEEARARAERAAKTLRAEGADEHLAEALEGAQEQLSDVARALRQGTLFAVPSGQTSF